MLSGIVNAGGSQKARGGVPGRSTGVGVSMTAASITRPTIDGTSSPVLGACIGHA
jgi:hypothetical protein